MPDVTWLKWPTDQRQCEAMMMRKDKMRKNVSVLNLTRNYRPCSCHFDKKKISTDGYMRGDPVYFVWNNWKKPLVQGGV